MKTWIKKIISITAMAVVLIAVFLSPQVGTTAYAVSEENKFDETNVMDDLAGSTIEGEPFDLRRFGFDEKKNTDVISFVEYCYSFYGNLQGNYGLYLYVYNPKGLKFAVNSPLNTVNFRVGTDKSALFHKYPLRFLNTSTKVNYEGLFYKFKVNLTDEERAEILETVNSTERVYRIAEIELLISGQTNATSIPVSKTYTYSGYAKGYGSNESAEDTLTWKSEKADTLELKPYTTAYRPSGTNGKTEYTQDSLHSVYFAVPNEFIKAYGEMSAVHATWLNAVLAPMLITGNESAYDAILPFLGKNIGTYTGKLDYHYYGGHEQSGSGMGGATTHTYGFGYNAKPTAVAGNVFISGDKGGYDIETLYSMFYADGAESADKYILPSQTIIERLKADTRKYGGELVNGKYSKVLFESVDNKFTEINIKRDETFDLTSQTISKTWWDRLWGAQGDISTTSFNGIKAIYPVSKDDLSGTKDEVCKRLFISTADYEQFKEYFETNEGTSTVYLFRYQVSDYISQEATLYKGNGMFDFKKVDTSAYFFQETANLDFDIIDVTFSQGEVDTVIPVAMSPIDVVPSATPPIHTTKDPSGLSWWEILLAIVMLVLVAVVIFKLVKGILSLIFHN